MEISSRTYQPTVSLSRSVLCVLFCLACFSVFINSECLVIYIYTGDKLIAKMIHDPIQEHIWAVNRVNSESETLNCAAASMKAW